MFKGHYNAKRFKFLDRKMSEWRTSGFIKHRGPERIRKTACFYGVNGNFYVDTSDGVNEDLDIKEYTGRILSIIDECNGSRFLVFKTSYSPDKTSAIKELARKSGGDIVPFFVMCYYQEFYRHELFNRNKLIELREETKKKYDIGFCSKLRPYKYPKEDSSNKWYFGIGSKENNGHYHLNTRQDLYDKLMNSRFKFYHHHKLNYNDYIKKSFEWKVCLNPPGIGEYTARMLEHSALGQAVILRKNSYDNAVSYKSYFPEVDFNKVGWEDDLQKIVDNYEYWERRSAEYYELIYDSTTMITSYMMAKLKEYKII